MKFPKTAPGNYVNVLRRNTPPSDKGLKKSNNDKILLFYLDPRTYNNTSSILAKVGVQ
jgi:hypothetical protein